MLIFAMSSVGVAVSSFFKSQIPAFLTSAVIFALLNIISSQYFGLNLPLSLQNVLTELSLSDRLFSVLRGVWELRDLAYFLVLSIISIAIAMLSLERYRVPKFKTYLQNGFIVIGISAIIGILLIYTSGLSKYRLDLTKDKKYSLSDVTEDILKKEGVIKIDVYISKNLPTQFRSIVKEIDYVLNDYQRLGGSNLKIEYKDPKENETALRNIGVYPLQFNSIGQDKYEVQQGYLSLVVYKEDDENNPDVIDLSSSLSNYEYEITSRINRLKQGEKPKIGFVSGNGEKSIFNEYNTLNSFLSSGYTITDLPLPSGDPETEDTKDKTIVPDLNGYALLVIADPQNNYTQESKDALKAYLDNGGNILYLASTFDINTTGELVVTTPELKQGLLFEDYGAVINTDVVYDTVSNVSVQPNVSQNLIVSYPFFVKSIKKERSIPYSPDYVIFPWVSSISLLNENWKVLYETSDKAGTQTENFNLDPFTNNPSQNKKLALAVMKEFEKNNKLVMVGDSKLFENDYITSSQENVVFGFSLFEYLAQGNNLSKIRAKNLLSSQFSLIDKGQKSAINYTAPALSAGMLAIAGMCRFIRKRKLSQKYS